MSAEIVRLIPRRKRHHDRQPSVVRVMAHPSVEKPDDLIMDHFDTSPCEYVPCPCEHESDQAIRFCLSSRCAVWLRGAPAQNILK
jgi:hypothetical protein